METMKLMRAFAVLLAMISLVACSSDDVPGSLVTGVFVDSTVEGLGYECGDDPVRYFTNEDGDVSVVKAGRVFELLATNSMEEVTMASPALEGDTIYVRTTGHVIAIRSDR